LCAYFSKKKSPQVASIRNSVITESRTVAVLRQLRQQAVESVVELCVSMTVVLTWSLSLSESSWKLCLC